MRLPLYSYCRPEYADLAEAMRRSARHDFHVRLLRKQEFLPNYPDSGDPILQGYLEKSEAILHGLKTVMEEQKGNGVMVWADADCYFLRPCADDLIRLLGKLDAVWQDNGIGNLATGFFAMRANAKMVDFWQQVMAAKQFYTPGVWHGYDEAAVQSLRKKMDYAILPIEYWTPCFPLKQGAIHGWEPPKDCLPKNARMLHLSCCYPPDKRRVMAQLLA